MSTPAKIVWLASFPKSGNTWFRILLSNLAGGDAGPSDINDLYEQGGSASNRSEFEALTMLDSALLSHDEIDCLRPRIYEAMTAEEVGQRWIKVHDAYTNTPCGEPLFGRGLPCAAVYLVRDPRDVAVSLAFHHSTSLDSAVRLVNSADGVYCDSREGQDRQLRQRLTGWSGHVTSWLDQTEVPVHVVRYEDLLAAPASQFAAALAFAAKPATAAEIERAVRYADFAELRRQENEKGFMERISRTTPFFRSGRAEGWRDMLATEQVAAIERCNGAVMTRLGYALEAHRRRTA